MATSALPSPTWGDHLRRILADFDDQRVRSDINAMREMVGNLRVIVSRCCEEEGGAAPRNENLAEPQTPRESPPWGGAGNAERAEGGIPPPPPPPPRPLLLPSSEKPGCAGVTPEDCQAATARVRWENSHPSRWSEGAQRGGRRRKTRGKKYKSRKTRKRCHGVSGP